MAVLTIARELGSIVRGEELVLCNKLNLHCVSKSTLEQRFADLGIKRGLFAEFDECKPGFIGTINNSAECYWESLQTAVMQELIRDDTALLGRGGNFLLHGVVECLRIRLIASEKFRVQQVAKEYSISESEAGKLVRQSDLERSKFCEYYYGENWCDPANYDLVVNMEFIDIDDLAAMIHPLLPGPVPEDKKAELQLVIQAQIIKHTLFQIAELQLRFPTVVCDAEGIVTLQGTVASDAAKRRAGEIVNAMPGVAGVKNELVVILHDIPGRFPIMH